jgi:hypothetical protein
MACREKPVELQSKLASSIKSLMASTTCGRGAGGGGGSGILSGGARAAV